jgi:hypothetical protein|tara:strand:- start:4389 stop:4643 length:255 start_codon:yes stop_codon:yes gene_type:complete
MVKIIKIRKIKYLNKTNKGNTHPRTLNQIRAATYNMIMNNPMKRPLNRVNQSQRMMDNQLWKLRKNKIIKQQPCRQLASIKGKN